MATAQASDDDTVILLMGKTGYGKSATGNSILERDDAFQTSCDGVSETAIFADGQYTRYQGNVIRVIDSPGFCDTRVCREKGFAMVCEKIVQSMVLCSGGFHVLVMVLRYGQRFTEEDQSVVIALKKLFGSNILQKRCILLFTHGDQLDMENDFRNTRATLDSWLGDQQGDLKALVKDCRQRFVLFRNLSRDIEQLKRQRHELLRLALDVKAKEGRYNQGIVAKLESEREKMLSKVTTIFLRAEFLKRISLLQDSVHKARLPFKRRESALPMYLEQIHKDVTALREDLNSCGLRGKKEFKKLYMEIDQLEHTVVRIMADNKSRELKENESSEMNTHLSSMLQVVMKMTKTNDKTNQIKVLCAKASRIAAITVDTSYSPP